MNEKTRPSLDPLTQATVAVALVIVVNKPFYPVYVWYFVGNGVAASLGTLIAAPFFLAIPLLAQSSPLAARIALPLAGTVDTFLRRNYSARALVQNCFSPPACCWFHCRSAKNEKRWQRGMAVVVFALFILSRRYIGSPLHIWADADLAILFNLNAFAVASLMAFVTLRYAGVSRHPGN